MKTKLSTFNFQFSILLLLLFAVACTDNNTEPALSVNPRVISVPNDAASYTVAVTSDASWTAAVSWNPSWLSISPPVSGDGDGAITVSVDENNSFFSRTASIKVTAGEASRAMDLTQEGLPKPPAPPTAASTVTWIFGNQLWSDAIVIPECDKPASELVDSETEQGCAAAEYNGKKYYFYNRSYFTAHEATLCPSPWQTPLVSDYEALIKAVPFDDLSSYWAVCGYIHKGAPGAQGQQLLMFAHDQIAYFKYNTGNGDYGVEPNAYWMTHGVPVRCIAK
jgi:hypothetical protein